MLINLFTSVFSNSQILAIAVIFAFAMTFLLLSAKLPFLPHDQGRAYALNGGLSKGKLRGAGLIIAVCYVISSLLFVPVTSEYFIFCILFSAIMVSGYLDDASATPWSDYKKGLIDLIISVICAVVFIKCNSTEIYFFHTLIELNPVVYAVLAVILIWVSINVTNCSDGVDGLCASLSIITIGSYALLFTSAAGSYGNYAYILIGAILAYLWFNASPSSMLMGDAGSRAFGFFIAVAAMKSKHPFSFLLLAGVLVMDGGLGLAKVFLLRFLKIHILKTVRTPIHDEMRKNRGWSDTQVVFRFSAVQVLLALLAVLSVK